MHITLILGSIRSERRSYNPARFFADNLTAAGHTVNFIDLQELNLPLFTDAPEQYALPQVQQLLNSVLQAEAVALVFPEYNHDVSSTLRNALSFFRKREFYHRPIGLISVSDGQYGGVRALYAAKASFPTLGAVIMPTVVPIDVAQNTFPDDKTCLSPKALGQMDALITELSAYAEALKPVRTALTA